jgi:hypothetical protein
MRFFFTYAILLVKFYNVPSERVGYYLLPFAGGQRSGADFDRQTV